MRRWLLAGAAGCALLAWSEHMATSGVRRGAGFSVAEPDERSRAAAWRFHGAAECASELEGWPPDDFGDSGASFGQAFPTRDARLPNRHGRLRRAVPTLLPLRGRAGVDAKRTPRRLPCRTGTAVTTKQPADTSRRLPRNHDLFFAENDLVYGRYLRLSHDGSYQQIDQDSTGATEVDRGTWEQGADAVVLLHSERRGLRFHAVRSGPLTVVLDTPETIAALPEVAATVRRLLATSQDDVFAADAASELGAPPAAVSVDRQAETFGRNDLTALAAQCDEVYQTEQSRTYRLTPVRPAGGPLLIVLQGATFPPAQVEAVLRDYVVPRGEAPPFYFAQTDARTFANRVGRYRGLPSPGGLSEP